MILTCVMSGLCNRPRLPDLWGVGHPCFCLFSLTRETLPWTGRGYELSPVRIFRTQAYCVAPPQTDIHSR